MLLIIIKIKNKSLMSLAIVVPVYNEEHNIVKLLNDWDKEIKKNYKKKYRFIIINDGSTDRTDAVIKSIKKKNFVYVTQKNAGHGNACLKGYRYAIKLNFKSILQIDGDNQCDPSYFKNFLKLSRKNKVVFGYRISREDGLLRLLFSRILSLLIFVKKFVFIKDANVPYRLINKEILSSEIKKIPKKILLKNVYLSYLLKKNHEIAWVDINFKNRYYGNSTLGIKNLATHLLNLIYYI